MLLFPIAALISPTPTRGLLSIITFTLLGLGAILAFKVSLKLSGQIYYGLSSLLITTGEILLHFFTPDRRQSKTHLTIDERGSKITRNSVFDKQSKTLLTIDERGSKISRNSVSIAICHQTGDKWQSKTLFLTNFDLRSTVVLTFSIAAYPMCF